LAEKLTLMEYDYVSIRKIDIGHSTGFDDNDIESVIEENARKRAWIIRERVEEKSREYLAREGERKAVRNLEINEGVTRRVVLSVGTNDEEKLSVAYVPDSTNEHVAYRFKEEFEAARARGLPLRDYGAFLRDVTNDLCTRLQDG
jgi:hypothetical protein